MLLQTVKRSRGEIRSPRVGRATLVGRLRTPRSMQRHTFLAADLLLLDTAKHSAVNPLRKPH
jgi:hypothetical protein